MSNDLAFLELLLGEAPYLELRTKRPGSSGAGSEFFPTASALLSRADALDDAGLHLWFGVAPRRRERGRAEDCETPAALWADIDPAAGDLIGPTYWRTTLRPLLPTEPSVVVHSGRGVQLYWLLDEAPGDWAQRQAGLIAGLRECLDGFPVRVDSVTDVSRVMRLPGTINPKNGMRAEIIEFRPHARYNVEEFEPASTRSTAEEVEEVAPGNRNNSLFQAGRSLKWSAGFRGEALSGALSAINRSLSHPLPQHEVEGIVSRLNDPTSPQPITAAEAVRIATDADLAGVCAERLSGEIMVVPNGGKKMWFIWSESDGIWRDAPPHQRIQSWMAESLVEFRQMGDIPRTVRDCDTIRGVQAAVSHLEKSPELPTYVEPNSLNAEPMLLPVRNGYLDLRNSTLIKPDPSYRFTRRAEVEWDPSATCPTWERFIDKMVPDKQEQAFLGQCFFFCLTGLPPIRTFIINIGAGRNGKTVAWEMLRDILGGFAGPGDLKAVTHAPDSTHDAPLAALRYLRLALFDELSDNAELNGAQVKRLTGGDRVAVRAAYSPAHEDLRTTAKLVLVSNYRPHIQGQDQAIVDRLRFIEWNVRLDKREVEVDMKDRLLAERNGILNWIMRHRDAFFADPQLTMPETFDKSAREYAESEDEYLSFLRTYCLIPTERFREDLSTSGAALARKWKEFTGNEVRGRGFTSFYREIVKAANRAGCHAVVEGDRTKHIRGLQIIGEEAEL